MTTRRNFIKGSVAAAVGAVALGSLASCVAKSSPKAKRVLIIPFDGIRVDGLKQANTPGIDSLIADGCVSYATRDVMPSVTLPNFTSILTGCGPEVHGVVDNGWKVDNYKLASVTRDPDGYTPSIFAVLKASVPGVKTAFYWNWRELILPYNPKYFDETLFGENDEYVPLYDRAFEFMKENKDNPTLIFLYTVHTDHAGHNFGWMSPEYIASIEEGDKQVVSLIEKLKAEGMYDDTHIMFISDHGGIGTGHGGVSPEEMTVPWVIKGPGIKKGFEIVEPNNTVNTATTVARLFGVSCPDCWTGEVPETIFEEV